MIDFYKISTLFLLTQYAACRTFGDFVQLSQIFLLITIRQFSIEPPVCEHGGISAALLSENVYPYRGTYY